MGQVGIVIANIYSMGFPLTKNAFRQLIIILGILVALIIGLGYTGIFSETSPEAYQIIEPPQNFVSRLDLKSMVQSLAELDF